MAPLRPSGIALLVVAAALPWLGGCAGQNSLLSSRTTVGSLRSRVSHLQYENEQLQKQVADLGSEKHRLEDELVQEEARSGDLAARLDDARHALRGRGDGTVSSEDSELSETPQRALPAGRSTRKKRKAPFAQIPSRSEPFGPGDEPNDSAKGDDDPGPQTWRGDEGRWVPIARMPAAPPARVR
jgi:hypothetical protein